MQEKLKEKLDESGIKAYYTRMDDVNPAAEQRVALANEVKADMYIAISVDKREEEEVYGVSTIYNDQYFIPGFGSVELADLLEKELASEIKTKALGLEKASGEVSFVMRQFRLPRCGLDACPTSRKPSF